MLQKPSKLPLDIDARILVYIVKETVNEDEHDKVESTKQRQ